MGFLILGCLLYLVFLVLACYGDIAVVTLNWTGGTPICGTCSYGTQVSSYACSYNNRGAWENGVKKFADPLPINSVLTGVGATLYGNFDCEETSMDPATVILELQKEDIAIVDLPPNFPCYCANCVGSYTVDINHKDRDWPGYYHGGQNTFHISVQSQKQICLTKIDLQLSYYKLTPFIGSIFPLSGPVTGGTDVTVNGTDFVDDTDIGCFFGTVRVPAVYVNANTMKCRSPSYEAIGYADFQIHDGAGALLSAEEHSFFYYETPDIKEYYPEYGPLYGGTSVTITGKTFFEGFNQSRCRFGFPPYSMVEFIDSNKIVCRAPPVRINVSQTVLLSFSPNGQQWVDLGNYLYREPPVPDGMLWIYLGLGGFASMVLVFIVCTALRYRFNRRGYELLKDGNPVVLSEIRLGARIGKGNFGEVYYGVWRGTEVAVKKLPLHGITEQLINEFQKEANLLKALRHPNVLQFLGSCTLVPDICLITEYMSKGSLYKVLHDPAEQISWSLLKKMIIDAARGCVYLHSCVPIILHRDLKSHNLLVDDSYKVKVCDFGLSAMIEHHSRTMTACGTPCWTAPEILRNQRYSEKADVYSFGVVLWECATRADPFAGMPPYQVIFAVGREGLRLPDPGSHVPPAYNKLIQDCWHEIPDNRPTMTEVLERLESLDVSAYTDNIPCPITSPRSSTLISTMSLSK